jgi:hypothetical protein
MHPTPLVLHVFFVSEARVVLAETPEVVLSARPGERVIDIIGRLLAVFRIGGSPENWSLWLGDTRLPAEIHLGEVLPPGVARHELFLIAADHLDDEILEEAESEDAEELEWSDFEESESRGPVTAASEDSEDSVACYEEPARARSEVVEDMDCDEAASSQARTSRAKRTESRRVTVRYYSRMNPDRVFPLLIMLTRDAVEKIARKHVGQKSTGPLTLDLDEPLEIEPVLPGCYCYPQKITSHIGGADETFTFHVVPHVVGSCTGARILIRQNHSPLGEIELDVRVVQRTLVMLSGASAVILPIASATLRHFGIDFSPRDGSNLHVVVLNYLVGQMSPLVLTAALLALTGILFWLTRPKGRDTFWDLETVGPDEELERVKSLFEEDPDAAFSELKALLETHPEFQSAWTFAAERAYSNEEYASADALYRRAMREGVMKLRDYKLASLSASRLGNNRKALEILQEAVEVLEETDGVTFFNMACYHCRLGQLEEAMSALRQALEQGYHKRESYLNDKDLAPLRGRADFKKLLRQVPVG